MMIDLPSWISTVPKPTSTADDAVMHYVIELARANVDHRTGGPFACAIVNAAGEILGLGVNLVEQAACCVFHAEIVAIINASDKLGDWDLGRNGAATLYASAEPCAMCMGAIPWSGVRRVVVSARDEDVRSIGFDEGVKPLDWIDVYASHGIDVTRDVCRDESLAVLRAYVEHGGLLYNG